MACSAKPCSLILQNAFTVNTILTILQKKKRKSSYGIKELQATRRWGSAVMWTLVDVHVKNAIVTLAVYPSNSPSSIQVKQGFCVKLAINQLSPIQSLCFLVTSLFLPMVLNGFPYGVPMCLYPCFPMFSHGFPTFSNCPQHPRWPLGNMPWPTRRPQTFPALRDAGPRGIIPAPSWSW